MAQLSWNDYQKQYQQKHYSQLSAHLDQELVKEFKKKLKEDNITYSDFIRNAINKYLGKK